LAFYQGLATYGRYGAGWTARLAEAQGQALRMARAGSEGLNSSNSDMRPK